MRILLLCHSFNSLTQRVHVELRERGHIVSVELDINDKVTGEAVELFRPDLVIASFLKRAIPEEIWRSVRCLVVHPGARGDRGPSALDWAILDAATRWSVTLIEATAEMDALRAARSPPGQCKRGEVTEPPPRRDVDKHDLAAPGCAVVALPVPCHCDCRTASRRRSRQVERRQCGSGQGNALTGKCGVDGERGLVEYRPPLSVRHPATGRLWSDGMAEMVSPVDRRIVGASPLSLCRACRSLPNSQRSKSAFPPSGCRTRRGSICCGSYARTMKACLLWCCRAAAPKPARCGRSISEPTTTPPSLSAWRSCSRACGRRLCAPAPPEDRSRGSHGRCSDFHQSTADHGDKQEEDAQNGCRRDGFANAWTKLPISCIASLTSNACGRASSPRACGAGRGRVLRTWTMTW